MLSFLLFLKKKEIAAMPKFEERIKSISKISSSKNTGWVFPQDHAVAIYTAFSILEEMKKELGLEAMLEYMGKYRCIVEADHPPIKSAVCQALTLMNVERIYKEAAAHEHL